MMFQANKPVYIFGNCEQGIEITIEILGKNYSVKTDADEFCFLIDELPVIKKPFEFKVASKNHELIIKDCLAGDVFICTGQSNMQFTCNEAKDIDYQDIPSLRMYEVPKLPYENAEKEFEWLYHNDPKWVSCTKESAKWFSAIGYLVGRDLSEVHDIPIGIVSCNMGDTTIFSWIDQEELQKDKRVSRILDTYKQEIEKFSSYEDYNKYFMKQLPILMEFYGVIEKGVAKGKSSEEAHADAFKAYPNPYLPMGPKNQNRPSGCFEMMMKKIVPFSNKGFLYYQGENDKVNHDIYGYGLELLVSSWRKVFKDHSLPFVICQIAGYQTTDLYDFESGRLRDRQREFLNVENRQYVVTAVDQGEEFNIHPKNKNMVAKRFFDVIEEYVYENGENSLSPQYASYDWVEDFLIIYTKDNPLDLTRKPGISGFKGVFADGERDILDIHVAGNNLVITNVSDILELRYAYDHYPVCSIYTTNGLPLLPFRIVLY